MDSRRSVHFAFLAFEKLGYSQLRSESTNVTALILIYAILLASQHLFCFSLERDNSNYILFVHHFPLAVRTGIAHALTGAAPRN
jgi:hypothetical protein